MPDETPTGLVFDIQRFCTHDGPGVRTTVFLKGCPLDCVWCHNPESKQPTAELFFAEQLCIDCGACAEVCPVGEPRDILARRSADIQTCPACLRCAEVCPAGAIEQVGRLWTVDGILAEVEKDRVFYEESGGGLTVSGGEPVLQYPFTHALLTAAHARNLHTCLETSGAGPAEHFEAIVPTVDLFLWDVKDTDPARHRELTGVEPGPLQANLARVDQAGGRTLLRCLLLAGINLDEAHLEQLARLYGQLRGCTGIELLAYHPYGNAKRQKLGLKPTGQADWIPSAEQLAAAREWLVSRGVPCYETDNTAEAQP